MLGVPREGAIGELGGDVVRISVVDMRDSTFYARITMERNGGEFELDLPSIWAEGRPEDEGPVTD